MLHSKEQLQNAEYNPQGRGAIDHVNSVYKDGTKYELQFCPEERVIVGGTYFKLKESCRNSNKKYMAKMVTVVINLLDHHAMNMQTNMILLKIIEGIKNVYPAMPIIVALPDNMLLNLPNIVFVHYDLYDIEHNSTNSGSIWNDLIKRVKTPYVLIARNVMEIDQDIQLERLLREIGPLNVSLLGGAVKDSKNGHWTPGCQQMIHKNYGLIFK